MTTPSTEIVVIDSPRGAAWALGAYRPRHERAHVLCRATDEHTEAFGDRVLERSSSISKRADVLGLTLVLGTDPTFNRLIPRLGHRLASYVAPSGFINLIGIGACQREVFEWFDSLRELVAPSVVLDVSFPRP